MSTEEPGSPSRRALLQATGAAAIVGTAGLVAACGSSSHASSQTTTIPPAAQDVELLNHALDLKHYVIAAYTAATPYLVGRGHAAGKKFLGEELAHASALINLIQEAGGTANSPQSTYPLGHPRSRQAILRLLDMAENKVIANFIDLIPELSSGSTRATIASIVSNDAQHVSVLRLTLHKGPIPDAFVTGHE